MSRINERQSADQTYLTKVWQRMWEVQHCSMGMFRNLDREGQVYLWINSELTNGIDELQEFKPDLLLVPVRETPAPTGLLLRSQLWSLHELLEEGLESEEIGGRTRSCLSRVNLRVLNVLGRIGEFR